MNELTDQITFILHVLVPYILTFTLLFVLNDGSSLNKGNKGNPIRTCINIGQPIAKVPSRVQRQ